MLEVTLTFHCLVGFFLSFLFHVLLLVILAMRIFSLFKKNVNTFLKILNKVVILLLIIFIIITIIIIIIINIRIINSS